MGSIRNFLPTRNLCIWLITTMSLMAFFGTALYHIANWRHEKIIDGVLVMVSILCGFFLAQKAVHEKIKTPTALWTNTFLLLTLATFFKFLIRHQAATWAASPWQLFSIRAAALLCAFFIFFIGAILYKKISPWIIFLGTTFFVSLNSILFPRGFGFDIFVHEATIREWMQHGSVQPTTILYNGFHAIIAISTSLLKFQSLTILTWLTPCIIGVILALLYTHAHTRTRGAFILLSFFALLPTLWTTTTPQALGHILFFGLVIEYWLGHYEKFSRHEFLARAITCIGILLIHPLSGIPAMLWLAWITLTHKKNFAPFIFIITICAPAAALIFGAHAHFSALTLNLQTLRNLFGATLESFQPFVITRLAFAWHTGAPIVAFGLALYGAQKKSLEKKYIIFSLALLGSAFILTFIRLDAIIGYEQSEFARRLLLGAEFFWIPGAIIALETIFSNITRPTRSVLIGVLMILACAGWYTAYTPWNTIQRTKISNVSPADFEIVRAIDAHSNGAPYVVLADQITSAAALHEFGFSSRQLPTRDYYFYPIPTGGKLYTNFFLPAIYNGITRELLERAANEAGVNDVFIILKPYWEPSDAAIDALKTSATDWWKVGDAYVGHVHILQS